MLRFQDGILFFGVTWFWFELVWLLNNEGDDVSL
jgi:hypothetical protein